jgi:hypothetical protein
MLDHLFLDTVGALRRTLDESLLECPSGDDRLLYDLLSGDLVWETSVSLPGDGDPPKVSADISLDWQTWSQVAWRSVALGESVEDPPEIGVEVVFRAQRLASRPPLAQVLSVLPESGPDMGGEEMARSAPVIEEAYEDGATASEVAVEVAYEGSYRLPVPIGTGDGEAPAEDASLFPGWAGARLAAGDAMRKRLGSTRQVSEATEGALTALGAWVASTLVQLADLDLDYLPPLPGEP